MTIGAEYERLILPCHRCGTTNIINRASDLGDTGFAIGKELPCQNVECTATIRIGFETADPDYQLLIWEALRLRVEKRYMLAVTALAQAFEMFFALAVEVMLVHHIANFSTATVNELEYVSNLLFDTTKKYAYSQMRNLFIALAMKPRPTSSAEAEELIRKIPELVKDHSDDLLRAIGDAELGGLLLRLKALTIGSLRNRVIHKRAYRPKVEELDESLDVATRLTGDLWIRLSLSRSLRGG